MSEEEKQVIKELIDSSNLSLIGDGTMIVKNTTIATILNYIDKLQKQLDKLKEVDRQICCEELITKDKYQDILKENEELQKELEKYEQLVGFTTIRIKPEDIKVVTDNFISKDIIRDKIKEYNEQRQKAETKEINDMFVNYIDILNELLGE